MDRNECLDVLKNMANCWVMESLDIDEASKEADEVIAYLDKLIEHDTPKKVLNMHYSYNDRADLFIEASCPSCGDDIFDCAAFCECGQRLDWSE